MPVQKRLNKEHKMDNLREIVLESGRLAGACACGIATVETLAGGPESADLTRVLPGAKSAISFAYCLDTDAIDLFLSKKDRRPHERNNIDVNILANGAALNLAGYLDMKGYRSFPVIANNYYRTDTPGGALDMVPDISLRYLAVRSGVGYFGLSGNVITPNEGAAVILGAVVTTAELAPTEPLPSEENYCDSCRLCMASCASGLMEKQKKTTVTLGGLDFQYSKRKSYLRCEYVCGGFTGLHPSGKWSTWSPGRFPIPENDEEFLPALMNGLTNYCQWPDMGGGYYHVLSPYKMYLTCGNCQLVCHPDREERKRRHRLLTKSGVVVQNEDGSLEAMPQDKARERMEGLPQARRALYETV
jgi:epoxyqueuosine reductase